jgi:opacity protein-like surface antigen
MNRTRILSLLAASLLLGAWPASAQYASTSSQAGWTTYRPASTIFTAGYQMAQSIGSLHSNYIDSASFRGAIFDWRSMLTETISAGLRFNWNRFNQTFDNLSVTTPSGGTATGPVFRYEDQFAIEAIAHYYFAGSEMLTPFAGFGIGGVWGNSYQQTADLANSQNGFYFIVSPEAGLVLWLARGSTSVGLNFAVTYNFTTISFRNVSNAQSLSETISLAFAY